MGDGAMVALEFFMSFSLLANCILEQCIRSTTFQDGENIFLIIGHIGGLSTPPRT